MLLYSTLAVARGRFTFTHLPEQYVNLVNQLQLWNNLVTLDWLMKALFFN